MSPETRESPQADRNLPRRATLAWQGAGIKGQTMKQTLYWTLAIPLTAIAALVVLKLMTLAI